MINQNIRHAISTIQNNIQMDELFNHHKMSYLKKGILHADIDLYWTKIWLKWNPFEKLTSQQLSKTIGKRIRTITQQLPTGDILNRNYPLLIKDIPTCPQCNVVAETQDHFWSCPNTISNLYSITVNNINSISMVIHDNNPNIPLSVIVDSFYSTDTFKWINFYNPMSPTNTYTKNFRFLCQHTIPADLPILFKRYYRTRKNITIPLTSFLIGFHSDFISTIWQPRCETLHNNFARVNIFKKDLKHYHKTFSKKKKKDQLSNASSGCRPAGRPRQSQNNNSQNAQSTNTNPSMTSPLPIH